MPESVETRLLTAEFFVYDWDLMRGTVSIRQMNEQNYRDSAWLDDRILSVDGRTLAGDLKDFENAFINWSPPPAPVIFHAGHCGSTLLSRIFSSTANMLPLREPIAMRRLSLSFAMVDEQARLLDRAGWNGVAGTLMTALSRTFSEQQTALIKATSDSNNLIAPLIENGLLRRALLLYQPLDTHLTSTLRIDKPHLDLHVLGPLRMRDWMGIPGTPKLYLNELSPAESSVISWLSTLYLMLEAKRKFPDSCRLQDFNSFLLDPEKTVSTLSKWLGLDSETEGFQANLEQVMTRNAKNVNKPFTVEHRKWQHAKVLAIKADEITQAMHWARDLTRDVSALAQCRAYIESGENPDV